MIHMTGKTLQKLSKPSDATRMFSDGKSRLVIERNEALRERTLTWVAKGRLHRRSAGNE
jgi:hypothetical protein